jgi:hypothetical protein
MDRVYSKSELRAKKTLNIVVIVLCILISGVSLSISIGIAKDYRKVSLENVKLKKENVLLEGKLETKSSEPVDLYGYEYSSNNETETFGDKKSYWFVVWSKNPDDGSRINGIIEQEHPYFSMKDFKEKQGKKTFLLNLERVTKEAWEDQ